MTDNIVFTNNASATLAASISASDLTIQVAFGFGRLFPNPSGNEYFMASLEDNAGNIEIVRVTGRAGDNLTVQRAQDGSTARAFTLRTTRVELRLVKAVMEEFLQKNGGTMAGNIDMNQNTIIDPHITGPNTRITAGQIVGVALRGDVNVSSNEIAVPSGGGRATVGGAQILAKGDNIVAELDTAGTITLGSATTGVVMDRAGAYFRMRGAMRIANSSNTDWLEMSHDGTDFAFNFINTAEVNWTALLNTTAAIRMNDNLLQRAVLQDFAVDKQAVTAAASTSIDYTAGSYVELALNTSITTLILNNPSPATSVAVFRLKITQGSGGQTIAWPASVRWPAGTAPTLSTGAGNVDFVDLWTDNGGTIWYGAFNLNWS